MGEEPILDHQWPLNPGGMNSEYVAKRMNGSGYMPATTVTKDIAAKATPCPIVIFGVGVLPGSYSHACATMRK
jgi:hypothetical protein